MILRISNAEVQELLTGSTSTYPKYSTQIMNLANQNAQGTRPNVVGQMSDLIQQFEGSGLAEWRKWYLEGHPNAIENATNKVWTMIGFLSESIQKIDKNMVKSWIEELVIVKTFAGLKFQEAILKRISEILKLPYIIATPKDESQGIDGYIGKKPASIKPVSYKTMLNLNEHINVSIIYYDKRKDDIQIEFEPKDFV